MGAVLNSELVVEACEYAVATFVSAVEPSDSESAIVPTDFGPCVDGSETDVVEASDIVAGAYGIVAEAYHNFDEACVIVAVYI